VDWLCACVLSHRNRSSATGWRCIYQNQSSCGLLLRCIFRIWLPVLQPEFRRGSRGSSWEVCSCRLLTSYGQTTQGSTTARWITRSLGIQSIQQIWISILWYWGSSLNGTNPRHYTTPPWVAGVVLPASLMCCLFAGLLRTGLPNFCKCRWGKLGNDIIVARVL
jgi:hypothetical protein